MTFANLSGGRDSTAMVVRYLELGGKIDYIVFCDTHYEFPQMLEYIDKLESYLLEKFNQRLTRLRSKEDIFAKWAFTYPITRGENQGKLRGLPKTIGMDYCTRELKAKPTREFVKSKSPNAFKNTILIGYTYNEVENGRTSSLDYGITEYPLHQWQWNEGEIERFLRERGIANPLYQHFERTGCFCCPKQSKKSLFNLFKFYPKEWEKCKQMEAKAKELGCLNTTLKPNVTCVELEAQFKRNSTMDFTSAYTEDMVCFCR
ncbi:phosphoadenosine phosphosulfate reductase family protein [Helicobacter rodentium]|uniref:phosphoadenosine phosphosulfate reductase domain-containing protein n=1 Tax=Helicobacter rodentium TaxID=59617 RepID=UPI000479AF34|nr:phosphoadenosine phosphosulfate reductase family protein [Helicobacter rodentium]